MNATGKREKERTAGRGKTQPAGSRYDGNAMMPSSQVFMIEAGDVGLF